MNCQELTTTISNIKIQLAELDSAVGKRNPEDAIKKKEEINKEIDKCKPELAERIFGQDFLGPEEIKAVFGLESIEVPPIPFSLKDLKRAKELGQMLILHLPITMAEINKKLKGKVKDGAKLLLSFDESTGKLKDDCWFKDEPFYTTQTTKPGWALVTKHVLGYKDGAPDEDTTEVSTSKNYLKQTEILIKYLREEVFKDKPIPSKYQKAIFEFETEKETKKPEELEINKLIRRLPVEVLYDITAYFQTTGERLLADMYDWTSICNSDSFPVLVGRFNPDGVYAFGLEPDSSHSFLGAAFSRSQ